MLREASARRCLSPSTDGRRIGLLVASALVALGAGFAVVAQTPPASTLLSVSGNVSEQLALTVDDLKRYPAHQVDYAPRGTLSPATSTGPARHYTAACCATS